MSGQKTMSFKVDNLTLAQIKFIKTIVEYVKHPVVNEKRRYTHMIGEDGSCYKRVLEATPTEMLEKMPGICLLLLDQPDIVEVSIKRPSPGHPTIGMHYVEDVIKLRSNENEQV